MQGARSRGVCLICPQAALQPWLAGWLAGASERSMTLKQRAADGLDDEMASAPGTAI